MWINTLTHWLSFALLVMLFSGCGEVSAPSQVAVPIPSSLNEVATPPANPLTYVRATPLPEVSGLGQSPIHFGIPQIARPPESLPPVVKPPQNLEQCAEVPAVPVSSSAEPGPAATNLAAPLFTQAPANTSEKLAPPQTEPKPQSPVQASQKATGEPVADPNHPDITWVPLAKLEVAGYPDKTAQLEAVVKRTSKRNKTVCELLDTKKIAIENAKWLPLPINIYNLKKGRPHLPEAFHETLDFHHQLRHEHESKYSCPVDFVRGAVFRAFWRVSPIALLPQKQEAKCSAQLQICLDVVTDGSGKLKCQTNDKWYQILKLTTHISLPSHLYYRNSKEREKDDVTSIVLTLKNLTDGAGQPTTPEHQRTIERQSFISVERPMPMPH